MNQGLVAGLLPPGRTAHPTVQEQGSIGRELVRVTALVGDDLGTRLYSIVSEHLGSARIDDVVYVDGLMGGSYRYDLPLVAVSQTGEDRSGQIGSVQDSRSRSRRSETSQDVGPYGTGGTDVILLPRDAIVVVVPVTVVFLVVVVVAVVA